MPHQGDACPATIWKGDPKHSLAAKAQCRLLKGHRGSHEDHNGNHFTGTGKRAEVVVVRNKQRR
jgi:hypothetical protein